LRQIGFTSEDIGIDCENCKIIINVEGQAQEIANAVFLEKKNEEEMGAGD